MFVNMKCLFMTLKLIILVQEKRQNMQNMREPPSWIIMTMENKMRAYIIIQSGGSHFLPLLLDLCH